MKMRFPPTLLVLLVAVAACGGDSPYEFRRPEMTPEEEQAARTLYLELVKRTVTDAIYFGEPKVDLRPPEEVEERRGGVYEGSPRALSLLGFENFDNIRVLMEDVLARDVPGDFIEAGAWRGGGTIYMRAVLEAHGVEDRRIFVADSFEGFPDPNPDIPADAGYAHKGVEGMVAPFDQVRTSFERFGLLDEQVVFLKGWFIDTLPSAPIERLAMLRVDADMYESTHQALDLLYDKVSPGGYVIVDDYGILGSCRQAVEDFRRERGIEDEMHSGGWGAVYWKKP